MRKVTATALEGDRDGLAGSFAARPMSLAAHRMRVRGGRCNCNSKSPRSHYILARTSSVHEHSRGRCSRRCRTGTRLRALRHDQLQSWTGRKPVDGRGACEDVGYESSGYARVAWRTEGSDKEEHKRTKQSTAFAASAFGLRHRHPRTDLLMKHSRVSRHVRQYEEE